MTISANSGNGLFNNDSTPLTLQTSPELTKELLEIPEKSNRIWWYVAALVLIAIILIWVIAKK